MHLIQRGHDRRRIFTCSLDRHVALRYIVEALEKCKAVLHAYVFMDNHVHLLVTGLKESSISRFMQHWSHRYSRYFNKTHNRCGTLYDGRFRGYVAIEPGYLLRCMRYIERNPVRAGICSHPSKFPWSSHAENARGAPKQPLSPHPIYESLGRDAIERAQRYKTWCSLTAPDEEIEFFRSGIRPRPMGRPTKPKK